MKKENRFLIAIILIAIITLIGVIFFAVKYPVYKANKDAESIQIGDNSDLDDTPLENIEQDIIHYDDEIGTLTIPDILLDNAPIRESVELSTLSETIGHFPSTSIYEGNVGLASHNSGSQGDFFKNLKKIKIGSEIFYQTNYGTKRYVVTTKEIISEEDWSYLQETEDNRITLITCVAGQKDKRLCVQAIESSEGMSYGQ
ncbi:MAG: class D sortase [Methanobrevibacter woesei]|nr:class D sortase [Methanobrevibacter woesei]